MHMNLVLLLLATEAWFLGGSAGESRSTEDETDYVRTLLDTLEWKGKHRIRQRQPYFNAHASEDIFQLENRLVPMVSMSTQNYVSVLCYVGEQYHPYN